jgi:tripartite-type tricarboxylate transporter receptor subunit TctC
LRATALHSGLLHRIFFATALITCVQVFAQPYPARPVRMLVPFAPGGTVDIVARLVGFKLAEDLGQPVLIENRGGAGGTIATTLLAKAPPDGYTLMAMHQGLAFNAALYSNLPYDTVQDLAPIAYLGATPNVLVVTNALPVRTVGEFLDYARRNPGRIAYGSGGVGSAGHLPVEMLQSLTGTRLTHVPYKGSGPALTDLVGGQIQAMVATMPAAMPFVKGGKVRAIATSGAQRSPALPELPTIAEAGVAGYEYMPWYGIFAPGALPKPIATRLSAAAAKALAEPQVRERLAQQGIEYREMTREQFAELVRADVAKWGKFIRDAGVRAE